MQCKQAILINGSIALLVLVAVDAPAIKCEHDTNVNFAGSSDSLGIGQLLFESRNCDLQLVDLVDEAALHLERAEQSMQTNSARTH